MNRNFRLATRFVSLALLAFLLYRRFHHPNVPVKIPDLIFSGPSSVVFAIAPESPNQWLATYSGDGHTAKFEIALKPATADESGISFAKGRLIAVRGSDSKSIVAALKTALEAKTIPQSTAHVSELPFTYAGLGEHQSRNSDGSFQSQPQGQWLVMKLFLPDGDEMGEVFLNLNPSTGQAEFSIKDPEFGDSVLRQLSTVL